MSGKRQAIVGDEGGLASQQGDVTVDEDVGGVFGDGFSSGEYVGVAAKTAGGKEDVEVSTGCEGQGSEKMIKMNPNDNARSIQ